MPLTKTADRYRGRARSKQKTIDRMWTPPTPPAAGEWPEYAVRSRLSEGAKAGLWLNPGKKGRANLYAVCTTHTP